MGGLRCQKHFCVFCMTAVTDFQSQQSEKNPSDFSQPTSNYNIIHHLIHFINKAPEFQYQASVPVKPSPCFPQEES